MPVVVPQPKQDPVKGLAPMVGSVIGGIVGGPAGAAAGGQIGGMVAKPTEAPGAVDSQASSAAIDRRLQTYNDNPGAQLAQADAALDQLPPEYRAQYGAQIKRARELNSQEAD